MKRTIFFLMAALTLLSSCEVHHFMTDSSYRAKVEADLQKRLEPERLKARFAVDKDSRRLTESDGFVSDPYLTTEEFEALEFLYAYMPLADLTDYSTGYYLQNVRASFTARNEMGWNVPEREFRHFVLPIRANNENLDTSRVVFYRELKPRIEGMSMQDAILEVNHWCHEKLTYKPSDARTLSPLSSVVSSLGRCGEESTFTVAALRAVGIPARQVYTPRWAHTDDNHAWVEAWADGKWYFLGACEPEPVLDLGWFNSPASRGLLMHTRVFGSYDGPEEKVMIGPNFTEINLIDNYAKTARVDFTVVDENGSPVDSALVDFKIYNYAEFYPALSKYTDAKGRTFLTAGMGDMMAWASKNGRYGYSKVSFGKDTEVTITISDQHTFDPQSMMIVPPPETANIPDVTPEQRAENDRRFAREDSIRKAYMATFVQPDGTEKGRLLALSAGNHRVIAKFLEDHPDERALALLKSLSNKDLIDVTREILDDSYNAPEAILCPRVENEFLSAYKSFFARSFGTGLQKEELLRPANLIKWVNDSITMLRDPKAWSIPMSPAGVYQARMADARSRNIFFVALARTLGLDARKDPVTGKIQYKDAGQWVDVDFEASSQVVAPTGTLVLNYEPTAILANPYYYSHFTISKIENGRTRLLTFDEGQVDMGGGVSWANIFKKGTPLDVGDYVLVSGNRLSDGSVPVTMRQFSVREGETTTLDLRITIPEDRLSVIGSFDAETRYCMEPDAEPVSVLSTTGRGFYVIGFLTPRQEPSVHAINDLIAAKSGLEAWGRPILLLTTAEGLGWLKEYSASLPSNIHLGIIPDGLDLKGRRMPYFLLADTFNRVFFTTEGYTIGLGDQLVTAIAKL
ncbi:MAG: transglutaminase-like domain-containing protein [Alistipes sp.]|nr:transglutaminase-like domain-containing protein [Alistipes sp.]MDY5199100.1 transglutaminase-like domain-containing protein [Candidatus Cryptobacteroides sp.]